MKGHRRGPIAGCAVLLVTLAGASHASAASILIGGPTDDGNMFPFTGVARGAGNRYQQVFDSSSFNGAAEIFGVTFFSEVMGGGMFTNANYTLSLSTTTKSVNALDVGNMQNNVGADSTFLFSGNLSGPIGTSFTLGGAGTFLYDPSLGNLLIDIQMSNIQGRGSGSLDAHNGSSNGLFSRGHNFGAGYQNFGLVTQFEVTTAPEPGTLALMGTALLGAIIRSRRPRKSRS